MLGNMYCRCFAATSALLSFLSVTHTLLALGVSKSESGLGAEQSAPRDGRSAHGAVEHDRPSGFASAHPGVGALPPRVAHVSDVRVTPAEVPNEVAVLHPHQPFAPALRVLPDQTLGEPRHHPGKVGAPLAVRRDVRCAPVLAPQ